MLAWLRVASAWSPPWVHFCHPGCSPWLLRVVSAWCVLPSLGFFFAWENMINHVGLFARRVGLVRFVSLPLVPSFHVAAFPTVLAWVHRVNLLCCLCVLFCLFFVLNHCTGLPSQTRVGDLTVALSASKIILPTIVCCPRQPVCERLVACLSESFANKTQFNACPSLSFCLTWSVGSSDCNFGHDAGLGVFCRHCCRARMFGLRISLMFHLQISNHV